MAVLTLKQIAAADDIQKKLVTVPDWGGDVWVYGLTGAEVGGYRKSIVTQRGEDVTVNIRDAQIKLVALATRDENGKRYFVGEEGERILAQKSERSIVCIFPVAQELSGLGDDSVKELVDKFKDDPLEPSSSD